MGRIIFFIFRCECHGNPHLLNVALLNICVQWRLRSSDVGDTGDDAAGRQLHRVNSGYATASITTTALLGGDLCVCVGGGLARTNAEGYSRFLYY